MGSKDLFSGHAEDYAKYRPRYPAALFDHLKTACSETHLAWDSGTGNGQAAVELASRFDEVIATDLSKQQLSQAPRHPKISYHAWPAERTELSSKSVDLIAVAQALHWFHLPTFSEEVRRVAKPGAVLAVWSYAVAHITPELDAVTQRLYTELLGPYWEPERKLVDSGYATLDLPIVNESRPKFEMISEMTCEAWLAYLNTWSALKNAVAKSGKNPIELLRADFEKQWGELSQPRPVSFPLNVRMGNVR